MTCWVYILECSDGSYYTGTHRGTDVEYRVRDHNDGKYRGYTFYRRPVKLVWCAEFPIIHEAIAWERQIKGWSRKKKEALISGQSELLPELASRKKES